MHCRSLTYIRSGQTLAIVATMIVVMLQSTLVQADMLVSPLRVYLDETNKTASVILRNPSSGPRTYRLEWIEQRMSVDGVYSQYKEGEVVQHSPASPYLRLSPRQITVPPKGNQSVRIHYRPSSDMEQGEYRSHLIFRVVPEISEPYSVSELDAGEGISLKLNMQLSVAIPVIISHQLSEPPEAKIKEVEPLPATTPGQSVQLAVVIQRSGMRGSFGHIVVEMQAGPEAAVERIGFVDNISLFADMEQRRVILNLRDQQIPSGAWLRVAYEGMTEFRGHLWDEQVFQIR